MPVAAPNDASKVGVNPGVLSGTALASHGVAELIAPVMAFAAPIVPLAFAFPTPPSAPATFAPNCDAPKVELLPAL